MIKRLLFALVIFSQTALGQKSNSVLPAPIKITSAEGITEYKLSNGLRVLLFPDQSKPTITVNITYLVGSRHEGYGETGMAHLLEHMLFKGSTKHTNIPQELTAHGGWKNASTYYDRTNYFEVLPANDENLKWALDLESDRMVNSFIAKKDLETEFSVVRNEFEIRENYPDNVLMERMLSTAYLWHNYGKSTIGSKEDIERVPVENLKAFYKKYYQPDNAVLLVAGKIDEAKTLSLINSYFGKIPKPSRQLREPYTVEPVQDGERFCELRRTGDVQNVGCVYHICSGAHPDFSAIAVFVNMLTDEPSGRLYKALVETQKASSLWGYANTLKDPGYVYFNTTVLKEKSIDEAKRALLNVLDSAKNIPASAEEVERAKNKILKSFELAYNNIEWMGMTLSEYIAQGDWRLWFLYRNRIEKVTPEDVNRVIQTYFKPSNRTYGVFIPETNPDRAQIPASPDVTAALQEYKPKATVANADAFDPSTENIDKLTKTGVINGGAKYALLKKASRGQMVNANITLHIGSVASLENKDGVMFLTAWLLKKGTTAQSYTAINDTLDKLKARVYIFGYGQNVTVSIEAVKENLTNTLNIVADILRHPSFPANEFENTKNEVKGYIEESINNPDAIANIAYDRLTTAYPPSDFRYPKNYEEQIADLKQITLEEVKKLYTEQYNGSNATAVVVGDFDEQPTVTALTSMFQNWNSPVKYERAVAPYFPPMAKYEKTNVPDKTNASFVAGINLPLKDDDADYPALIMGNYILGGGFLNSRLATRLRQKDGISYHVGSYVSASPYEKTGSLQASGSYNPDNAEKILTGFKEEVAKAVNTGFAEQELKDAKSGYLQEKAVNRAQDQYLAYILGANLEQNKTMKTIGELEDKISKLTPTEVNAAIKKWINPANFTYVQAGDFEKKKDK